MGGAKRQARNNANPKKDLCRLGCCAEMDELALARGRATTPYAERRLRVWSWWSLTIGNEKMELERELDLAGMGGKEGLVVELDTRMESVLA